METNPMMIGVDLTPETSFVSKHILDIGQYATTFIIVERNTYSVHLVFYAKITFYIIFRNFTDRISADGHNGKRLSAHVKYFCM
jgi:hypothetical protein